MPLHLMLAKACQATPFTSKGPEQRMLYVERHTVNVITRMVRGLESISYEDKLKGLGNLVWWVFQREHDE